MIRRLLITALLTFAILMLLLWPLSQVGLSLSIKRGSSTSGVSLQDGALRALIAPRSQGKVLERDEYRVAWGHWLPPLTSGQIYQLKKNTAGAWELGLPLLWPALATIPILGLALWYSSRRRRRHLARHICLGCGFQRASDEGPCTECGLHQTDLSRRSRLAPLIRDASIAALLCIGLFTWFAYFAWRTDQRLAARFKARVFDYSWYLQACTPSLSGEVFYAQPGSGPESLGAVLRRAGPGSTIVLLPGDHILYDPNQRRSVVKGLSDVWLLGSGRDACTLSIELEQAHRVRFEGVTINCNDTPFIDSRSDDMAVHLRDCSIVNYNSGAGGSNSIFSSGSVLLIEDCEFNGKEGRASNNMRGDALDLRGVTQTYARNTSFIDNDEIGRNHDMVLDHCRFQSDMRTWPPGPEVLTRDFEAPGLKSLFSYKGRPFTQAVDDYDNLSRFAAIRSLDAWSDPLAIELIDQIGIANDPDFWKRLLIHPKPEIRTLAQQQLRLAPPTEPEGAIEARLQQLDKHPLSREMVEAILSQPATSRPLLEERAKRGPAPEAGNAKALLRLMDAQPPITEILRTQDMDRK